MALKLIGAVGVKVRPEAENFRDEAERQIRRQYRDRGNKDGEYVDVKVRPKLDEDRMRRDFERHKDSMRRTMQSMMDGVEVQAPRISNSRFAKDAAKIRKEHTKLYSGLVADRSKYQRAERKNWGHLARAFADYEQTVASSSSGNKGRKRIVESMKELAYWQAEVAKGSDDFRRSQDRVDRASAINMARYLQNLNKARAELGRVHDQQKLVDRANFRGTNNSLLAMRGELEKVGTIFDDVNRQVREFGKQGAVKKLRVDVDTMKAWEDAQRFRHMWNQIPERERKVLSVRLQMEDNDAIQQWRDRMSRLRKEMGELSAAELRNARNDTRDLERRAAATDLWTEKLREARRVNSGWQQNNDAGANQRRDNERIMAEFRENQRKMREEADRTRDYIDRMEADIAVDLDGTKTAAARMMWLTRPRTIPIHVRITGKSLMIAEGIIQSLAGMNALQKLGKGFERIITEYDKFTIASALVTGAILNLTNALIGGVASIFSIGQGLAHVFQGAAMAPTLFGAIGTSVLIATVALKDFFSALSSGDFSNLTGNALKNAQMLEGTWTKLAEAIRDNFWEEAGTSMGEFVTKALPTLTRGLSDTAAEMGKLWDGVWQSMIRSLDLGYLDTMFDGLSGFMGELAGAAEPLMNAIMQLGMRGAEHLPRLGEWLREGAEGFEQFIAEADEAGKIDQWIRNSAAAFQDLGVVVRGTGKIMEGFSRAALEAGGPTLHEFANAMDRWGDAVQSVEGQNILGTLFEGAYEGLSRLGDGMGTFFGTLGEHIEWVADVSAESGGVFGALFDSLSIILDNPNFRDGTLQALKDIQEATYDLAPAFDSAADIIGNMARISGAVMKGIAPTINEVVGMVSGMVEDLTGPLIDLIPRLTASVGGIVKLIEPAVRGATGAVGSLVDGFNNLPGPIQTALLSAAGLAALRPHLTGLANAVGNRVLPAYTRWGAAARALQAEHQKHGRNISMMTAGYRHLKTEMAHSTRLARMQGLEIGRVGSAFAALDRITGSSLYGVYDGAVRARNGLHDMGQAVRSLARDNAGIDGMRRGIDRARASFTAFGNDVRTGPVGQGLTSIRDGFQRVGAAASQHLAPVAGHFQSIAKSAQDASGRVGTTMVGAFDRVRTSAENVRTAVSTGVTNFFPGLPAAADRLRGGMRNVAQGARDATSAIGRTAGTGLRSAGAGLSAAMGGPWGMALAGAAIAVGMVAQSSSEADARVKDFQDTLTSTGGSTFRTYQLGAEKAAETTGILGMGWTTFGETFYDAAKMVGVESRTITEAFAGNEDAIEKSRAAIEAFREEGIHSPAKTNALVELEQGLNAAEREAKIARQNMEDMGEALGTTGERAMVLTQTWDDFGVSVRAGMVSGEQFVGVMDQLTNGTLSAQDAAYNYQSSLKAGKDALGEWADAHGSSMASIDKHFKSGNKTLDMTKQSHRDLYGILRQQVAPAYDEVAAAFNNFGGGQEGVKAARDTMQGIRKDWMDNLMGIEGMTEESAGKLLDSLNINPDDVELLLEKSAAEQSLEEISASLKMLTGEDQVAKVRLEREGFDPLKSDAANAKEQLRALTSPIYRTKLEGEDRLSPVLDDVTSDLSQFAIKDWIAMIAATDNASGTIEAVRNALEGGFNNQSYEAVLNVLDNASGIAEGAKDKIMAGFVQGDYEAMMTAVDEASPEAEEVKGKLEAIFNGDDYQAFLDADGSSASEETQAVADAIGEIDNKTAVVTVTNTGADSLERQLKRIADFNDKTVTVTVTNTGADSLNRMKTRIDNLNDKTVTVTVRNNGAESLNRMQARIDNLNDKTVTVTVTNTGADSLDRMKVRLDGLQSKTVNVTVTNTGADSLNRLRTRIDNIKSKSAHVTVTNSGADSLNRLKGRIDAIKSKSAKVTVTNTGADSLVRLKGRMDAIRSKSAKVTVTNSGQDSLARMKSRIDAIRSKSERVTVTNTGASSLQRLRQRITAIRGKSVTVRANAYGHGGLYSLQSAINRVRGKTVYVNVRTRRTGSAFANGGITAGDGMQHFANGGITQAGKILDKRMRFAWENHTAQIAHAGATRTWAEPETGGEAYIPMSASKRTRSEDILGEVANRFGGEYINSRGKSSAGAATVGSTGDTYNITLPAVERPVADEVADDLTFQLRHMQRGGYAGGPN